MYLCFCVCTCMYVIYTYIDRYTCLYLQAYQNYSTCLYIYTYILPRLSIQMYEERSENCMFVSAYRTSLKYT